MTEIALERPDTDDAKTLIAELDATLGGLYPKESQHGYSVDKLLESGVTFFVMREDDSPVGCGGIQLYHGYGEVKRMYVRPAFRGRGLGRLMLDHLRRHARAHGVDTIRLETGVHQHEAISLYERYGFRRIEAFGEYQPDPLSVFFEIT